MPAEETEMPGLDAPVTLRVENISKNYGSFKALEGVSFEVRKGEVLGFLGPNGAGKTTAVRILTGFFPPTSGKVWIGSLELFKDPPAAKKKIGYLPETVQFYQEMRVLEYLEFVAALKDVPRATRRGHLDEKIGRCGLGEVRKRLIGQLSKGYRQRLGLAQALVADPEILVLDEPTNGLDPKQIIEIRSLIQDLSRECTLLLSTHILQEVSMVCDRVLILNHGKVVASGTAEELEAGLKKALELNVVIGSPERKDEALQLLKGLPGVEEVHVIEEKEEAVAFSLVISKGGELRPAITRLFVEHQIPLLELRSGRLSLEEIFMRIVVREGAKNP